MPEESTSLEHGGQPDALPGAETPSGEESPVTPSEQSNAEAEPAPETPPTPPAEPEPVPNNKHWYVVKVQSGREETIKESIERRVKIEGLEEFYGQIYIPVERVTEMRNGRRYTRERKILPGYIMAEVEYNDRILYLFRETTGVGDFVGATPTRAPIPMTPQEVARWMGKRPEEKVVQEKPPVQTGDRVRVKDGMFAGMEGEVKEIFEAKGTLSIEVTIFGRPVKTELEYWHVEPV